MRCWSISSCIHHLKSFTRVRMKHKHFGQPERIEFGAGLKWPLSELRSQGPTDIVIEHRGRVISSNIRCDNKRFVIVLTDRPAPVVRRDLAIVYDGSVYETTQLETFARQLVGSLFYVELVNLPQFYSLPDHCRVRLGCQIPEGPASASLQRKLRSAKVLYRGDELQWKHCSLLRAGLMKDARFSTIMLEIDVTSMDSVIDVQIGHGGVRYPVSRCPYKIKDIVRDQGLENPWMPQDHHNRAQDFHSLPDDWHNPLDENVWNADEWSLDSELSALYETMYQVATGRRGEQEKRGGSWETTQEFIKLAIKMLEKTTGTTS